MVKPDYKKLAISLGVDAVGMMTYSIPVFGESADVVWAPLSAAVIYLMYDSLPFAGLGFLEEATALDIFPTATVAWLYETYGKK